MTEVEGVPGEMDRSISLQSAGDGTKDLPREASRHAQRRAGDPSLEEVQRFWNAAMGTFTPDSLSAFEQGFGPTEQHFLQVVGDVRGKQVADIGCGNGRISLLLAKRGALVTAIDSAAVAVENTQRLARANGVQEAVTTRMMDAFDLTKLDRRFDLLVGSFVLHHLEPFDRFVDVLADSLRDQGRAIFIENSARNRLLMFLRRHIAGRFGVPRYGDREEHPLEFEEIEMLKRRFSEVHVHHPELLFFRMLTTYIFRRPGSFKLLDRLDDLAYRVPSIRRFTYLHVVEARLGRSRESYLN